MRAGRPLSHIPALDGVRGLAILLVLAFHAEQYGRFGIPLVTRLTAPMWMGVDLFLVLSGFLITRILIGERGTIGAFRRFYWRRTVRIFPLYYTALTLLAIHALFGMHAAATVLSPGATLATLASYTSNLAVAARGWGSLQFPPFDAAHFWSLAVEEQFYLVWPLVVLRVPVRWLARVCAAVFVGAFLVRVGILLAFDRSVINYVFTPSRLDTFAAGAIVASLLDSDAGLAPPRARRRTGVLSALSLSGFLVIVTRHAPSPYAPAMQTFGYSFLAIAFASAIDWIVHAPARSVPSRLLGTPVLRALGKYSYGLYVFHGLVFSAVFVRLEESRPHATLTLRMLALLGAVAITAACTIASYYIIELPFLRLKATSPTTPPATPG